jgi:hypothetical protein
VQFWDEIKGFNGLLGENLGLYFIKNADGKSSFTSDSISLETMVYKTLENTLESH